MARSCRKEHRGGSVTPVFQTLKRGGFQLEGVVDMHGKEPSSLKRDPNDFGSVETDAELQKASGLSDETATFEEAREVVQKVYGENVTAHIVERYKELLREALGARAGLSTTQKERLVYEAKNGERIHLKLLPQKTDAKNNWWIFKKK